MAKFRNFAHGCGENSASISATAISGETLAETSKNMCKEYYRFGLIFIAVTFFSCSASRELKEERKQWEFSNWEQYYKDRAFCLCFYEGFENRSMEISLIQYDRSFFNVLGSAIFDKSLQPLISKEVEKIRQDSIHSTQIFPKDLENLYYKRAVFNQCLKFYKSKELKAATKSEKKKWAKIPSIMGEVHKVFPTY